MADFLIFVCLIKLDLWIDDPFAVSGYLSAYVHNMCCIFSATETKPHVTTVFQM